MGQVCVLSGENPAVRVSTASALRRSSGRQRKLVNDFLGPQKPVGL